MDLFCQTHFILSCVFILSWNNLWELKIHECCTHGDPNVVNLLQRQLIQDQDVDLEQPAELSTLNYQLTSVDYVGSIY